MRRSIVFVLGAGMLAACEESPNNPIVVDDTGVVQGVAYVDLDGNGQFTSGDSRAAGVAAALLLAATGDTMARATSRSDGAFTMSGVPAGQYRLVARPGAVADSLDVLHVDPAPFTVTARDTVERMVRLGYPVLTLAAVRAMPSGRRVTVEGIALNGWSTFGDASVHIADPTGALRAIRMPQWSATAGDSVRIVATTGLSDEGRLALVSATGQVLSAARGLPPLDLVGTGAAATAVNGSRADGHVRISNAVVTDTATVAGDFILDVNDGSGVLRVVLDQNIQFNAGQYVPGATFNGAGVLVPSPTSSAWRLKPRERNEAVITFPTASVAEARTLPAGRQVTIEGIALNGWGVFADSTVHVLDSTGALRAVRVVGSVAAGDSVRLLGAMSARNGQPVLTSATATVIVANVGVPAADSVSTAVARNAGGGSRDADQVRVAGLISGSETLSSGDMVLTVDDGSGSVQVLVDSNVTLGSEPFVPGAILNVAGVLVPTGSGTWQIKPRGPQDASATYPTLTVEGARSLQVGRTAYVHGVALTSWVTFGDASLHLRDETGNIRIVDMPPVGVFAGDSVRILGTAAVRNGQPVLIGVSASVLQSGVGVGAPQSMSTFNASTAFGRTLDAGQVRTLGQIKSASTESATGDRLLVVDDGSGPVTVRLDADVGFAAGAYRVGDIIRVSGVLIPAALGTTWELKPRGLGEITIED